MLGDALQLGELRGQLLHLVCVGGLTRAHQYFLLILDELNLVLEVGVLDVDLLTDFVAVVLRQVFAVQHLKVQHVRRHLFVVAVLAGELYQLLTYLVCMVVVLCLRSALLFLLQLSHLLL